MKIYKLITYFHKLDTQDYSLSCKQGLSFLEYLVNFAMSHSNEAVNMFKRLALSLSELWAISA